MVYEYLWVEESSLLFTAPICRSKDCAKAHYRDGLPKVRTTVLKVIPPRKYYLSLIYMCERCKRITPTWDS